MTTIPSAIATEAPIRAVRVLSRSALADESTRGKVVSLHDTESAAQERMDHVARINVGGRHDVKAHLMWRIRQVAETVSAGDRVLL